MGRPLDRVVLFGTVFMIPILTAVHVPFWEVILLVLFYPVTSTVVILAQGRLRSRKLTAPPKATSDSA